MMPMRFKVQPQIQSAPPPKSGQPRSSLVVRLTSFFAALLSLVFSATALAQAGAGSSSASPSVVASTYAPSSTGGGMIWLTFITLLLLAGVVLLVAWLVHKNMTATVPNSAIRVLSVQTLGPRERIVIASVVGRVYVLGHTASTINLIAELTPEEVAGLSAKPAPTDFAARLSEILRKAKR
jgi:flagellar protein FliO/FliZ